VLAGEIAFLACAALYMTEEKELKCFIKDSITNQTIEI
jgi:hypothetical protein